MTTEKLKVIEFVSVNDGMYQGMFLDGDLLGAWHDGDADWRGEYYDGVFRALGYRVNYSTNMKGQTKCPNYKKLQAKLLSFFGEDEEYEE